MFSDRKVGGASKQNSSTSLSVLQEAIATYAQAVDALREADHALRIVKEARRGATTSLSIASPDELDAMTSQAFADIEEKCSANELLLMITRSFKLGVEPASMIELIQKSELPRDCRETIIEKIPNTIQIGEVTVTGPLRYQSCRYDPVDQHIEFSMTTGGFAETKISLLINPKGMCSFIRFEGYGYRYRPAGAKDPKDVIGALFLSVREKVDTGLERVPFIEDVKTKFNANVAKLFSILINQPNGILCGSTSDETCLMLNKTSRKGILHWDLFVR